MDIVDRYVQKKLKEFAEKELKKESGITNHCGVWNNRCYLNSMQSLHKGEAESIGAFLVVSPYSPNVILHFAPKVKGVYQENTLGFFCEYASYYLLYEIKEINASDYSDPYKFYMRTYNETGELVFGKFVWRVLGKEGMF